MVQYPELGSPPQRLRPDIWPAHQDPFSHMAQKKREKKKKEKKKKKKIKNVIKIKKKLILAK